MLKKLLIMLCCTVPKKHLFSSTNFPIMLKLCSINYQESIILGTFDLNNYKFSNDCISLTVACELLLLSLVNSAKDC